MISDFGQPLGGIIQFAYTVPNARAAAELWTALTGIGPWFFRGPFVPTDARYRGEQVCSELLVAQAYSGHAMIELIEQRDEFPSVYRETVLERGHGFHHIARSTLDFDGDLTLAGQRGVEVVYESRLPTGARLVYLDTEEALGGMLELVEMTDAQETTYTRVFRAAQGWDGTDPHRVH